MAFDDGRSISVRPIEPADAAGLRELFEGLPPQDRYRRFFNAYHPPLSFCTEQASVRRTGGQRLVAILHSNGTERIVGEAGYSLLPSGAGELSVTVSTGWRGWLGPFLLDALTERADAAGVERLEADVLAENGAMLAMLLPRRPELSHPDGFSSVHLSFPTGRARAVGSAMARSRGSNGPSSNASAASQ